MTPFDYANQIAELDPNATDYRQQVERVLHKAFADELCRVARLMDDAYRRFKINSAGQAIDLCREQARIHTDNT